MKRIFGEIDNSYKSENYYLRLRELHKKIVDYYPYLRHISWNKCHLGEFALFPGENKIDSENLILLFQGNLFEKGKNISDEEYIISLYKKYNTKFLSSLNGSYNFCLLDKKVGLLYVVSDKYASRPLYWYFDHNQFIFASEVKIILALLKNKPPINWSGLGQYLTFRFTLSNNTFHDGISLVDPATVIVFDVQNFLYSKKQYWNYSEIFIDYSKSENKKVDEGISVFKNVFSRLGEKLTNQKVIIPLSGGYDSRNICAGLASFSTKNKFDTITTLHPSGPIEREIAKKVAEKIGVKNYYVNRGNKIYQKYYFQKIFLTDGLVQEHLWAMPMLKKIKNYDVYIDGVAGDILLRGTRIRPIHIQKKKDPNFLAKLFKKQFGFEYDWLEEYLDPRIWRQIKYDQAWTENSFKKIDASDNRFAIFLMRYRIRNSVTLSPNNLVSSVIDKIIQPYFHDDIVSFGLSIPYAYKFTGIYRKILDQTYPKLKEIKSVSDLNPKKLADYDQKIIRFDENPRELIADYLKVSQQDYKFILSRLKKMTIPPFINKKRFLKDIQVEPKLNRLITIMDIASWFNQFQK